MADSSDVELLRLSVNKMVALFDTLDDRVLGQAACATATVTSQAKTTNQVDFSIDGAVKRKAAADNFWTLTGGVLAISSWQKWILCVDASGVASVVIGTASTVSAAAVGLPVLPASKSVFGTLTVATSGAVTFTPGTTLLGAAGITASFVDGMDPLYSTLAASPIAPYLVSSHK